MTDWRDVYREAVHDWLDEREALRADEAPDAADLAGLERPGRRDVSVDAADFAPPMSSGPVDGDEDIPF